MSRRLALLGSTGSIGTQALDIVGTVCEGEQRPEVVALAAGGSQLKLALEQAQRFHPEFLAFADADPDQLAATLVDFDLPRTHIEVGPHAVVEAARRAGQDGIVLNGINGGVGLAATLAALESGSQLALANKESLVVGAPLVRRACVRPGQITPVDSEHSAIAQCLASGRHERGLTCEVVSGRSEVARLILTASGGPFRGMTRAQLRDVDAKAALAHPTWRMGPVVTINSSTLMNKALEVIEAFVLFDVLPDRIDAVVHPQSVVHSMVEFVDGATIMQASPPDMHLPIALALSWPERWVGVEAPCRWDQAISWSFEPVDADTFPAIEVARLAMRASVTHPAVMNAANEVCVEAFLAGRIPYLAIVDTVAQVVSAHEGVADPTWDDIVAVQRWAERVTAEALAKLG